MEIVNDKNLEMSSTHNMIANNLIQEIKNV